MANEPVIYKFQDTQTGKTYQVESDPDATRDEASAFLDTLKPEELGQYELKTTPQTPAKAATPEVEATPTSHTVWTQGTGGKGDFTLDPVRQHQVDTAATTMPYEQYSDFVKQKFTEAGHPEAFVNAGDPKQYAAYQAGVKTKKVKPTGVGYHDVTLDTGPVAPTVEETPGKVDTILGAIIHPGDPAAGRDAVFQMRRGYDSGVQYGFPGWLARTGEYWMGAGQDELRKAFPGLKDDQYNDMAKALIAHTQEQTRAANAEATKNDNTGYNLLGQVPASVGPEDWIPGVAEAEHMGRAAKIAGKTIAAGGVNAAADAGYQGLDIHDDVSQEFNPTEVAQAAGLGSALHLGMEGVHGLRSRGHAPTEAATPTAESPVEISTPTANKRTKAYNAQLNKAADDVTGHINHVVSGWKNAPQFEVHDNFKDLPGIHKGAVAAITDDGKVVINTARVLEVAKRRGIDPKDVVTSAVFHEGLGHHGLQQVFRDDLDDTMQKLYDNGPDQFKRTVDKFMTDHPEYGGRPLDVHTAVEEVLAKRSENGPLPRRFEDTIKDTIKKYARQMGLNLKYSSREIRSILADAHDRVINGDKRESNFSGTRYMNVGEKTNDQRLIDRHEDALQMDKEGAHPEEIHKHTGWWKDQDGGWRQRISDADSHFIVDPETNDLKLRDAPYRNDLGDDRPILKLEDVFHHDKLYESYPFLKDIPVYKEDHYAGAYHSSTDGTRKEISINLPAHEKERPGWNGKPTRMDMRDTMLHEIQHAIQDHEGWARGGTPERAVKHLKDHEISPAAEKLYHIKEEEIGHIKEGYDLLRDLHAEPKVRRVLDLFKELQQSEREHGMFSDEFKEVSKKYHPALKDLKENVFHGNEDAMRNFRNRILHAGKSIEKQMDDLRDRLHDKHDDLEDLYTAINSGDKEQMKSHLASHEDVKTEAYNWLMGEIEARETGMLRNWKQEDLDKAPPRVGHFESKHPDYMRILRRDGESASMLGERRATPRPDSRMQREDQLLRRKKDQEKLRDEYRILKERGIKPSEVGLPDEPKFKYMMDDYDPAIDKLSPDDLFESNNALDLIEKLTENITPVHFTMDELRSEAERRNMSLSQVKGLEPGELTRRFFQQDIVADKLNEKLSNSYHKLNTGNFGVKDRDNYIKTLLKGQELMEKIATGHSEVGRALRSIKEMQFTLNKMKGISKVLGEFTARHPIEALQDPEVFRRFAEDVQAQIEADAKGKDKSKLAQFAANALNLPRALMASFDLSAPLRQGIFLIGREEFYKSFASMFKYVLSEDNYNELLHNITHRNTYPLMREAGLSLTSLSGDKLTTREENFMSHWAEKIPVAGRFVKGSERAYTGFLDKLRADTFDSLVAKADNAGIELDAKLLKGIGTYINNATGRGDLGRFTSSAPLLNGMFFSPRLIASRAQLLNPVYYAKQPAFVRKEALRDLLTFGALALTVTGLAHLSGATTEYDPRSSDFGKIKTPGNTRLDILGGFGQYIVLGARLASNQYKSIGADKAVPYNPNKYGGQSRFDALMTFGRNKLAPVPSFLADYLDGKNAVGEKFSVTSKDPTSNEVTSRFIPLFLQDYSTLVRSEGWVKGSALAVPGAFGVGIQNYDPDKAAQTRAETVAAPESIKMKNAPNMKNDNIEIEDGTITLNPRAQKAWQNTEDYYMKSLMKQVTASEKWKGLTAKERVTITREVKKAAYNATKAYILPQLVGGQEPTSDDAQDESGN